MAEVKMGDICSVDLLKEPKAAFFLRGRDLFLAKIMNKIFSEDAYHVWYVSDFKDAGTWRRTREALRILEKQGMIRRYPDAYPVYWKRNL